MGLSRPSRADYTVGDRLEIDGGPALDMTAERRQALKASLKRGLILHGAPGPGVPLVREAAPAPPGPIQFGSLPPLDEARTRMRAAEEKLAALKAYLRAARR